MTNGRIFLLKIRRWFDNYVEIPLEATETPMFTTIMVVVLGVEALVVQWVVVVLVVIEVVVIFQDGLEILLDRMALQVLIPIGKPVILILMGPPIPVEYRESRLTRLNLNLKMNLKMSDQGTRFLGSPQSMFKADPYPFQVKRLPLLAWSWIPMQTILFWVQRQLSFSNTPTSVQFLVITSRMVVKICTW
jgi:hypothetical protein